MAHEETLKFRTLRHWRAWHEWPGVLALATGIVLWIFLAAGVVAPLADALTRLDGARAAPAPACLTPPPDEALAAGFDRGAPACATMPGGTPSSRG